MAQDQNTESFTPRWEDPANSLTRTQRDWRAILEPLKERPGVWALVAEDVPANTIYQLRARYTDYEFTNRGVKVSRAAKAYARYVGGA